MTAPKIIQSQTIRVEAPDHMDRLDIAQAIVGKHVLLKAEQLKYSARTFQHYKAMAQSSAAFERAYAKQLDKIIARIVEYAEKKITLQKLDKADGRRGYDSIASPQHMADIRALISDYHLAFIATQVGPGFIAPSEVQRLIDTGILPQDIALTFQPGPGELPEHAAERIADAYNYGISMGRDPQLRAQAKTLNLADYNESHPPPRLSAQEKSARDWASRNAANIIVGLGNRIGDDFSTLAIEADADLRRQYQADIRDELDMNLERRETWRQLASELGHRTGDWARNFKRIAATEKQNAMQEGLAAGLIEREGDPEHVKVAKLPNPDACEDCIRLHLTAGAGSVPKTFYLSQLQENGTNVGRKRNAWKPVVGPVHPWCSCELIHVPDGWGFDEDGNLVPENLLRSDLLEADLRKGGHMTYGHIVPERGCAIRISDPVKKLIAEQVIATTPPEVFDKHVGVTLICEDEPRVENALSEHDLAYWTGNEIRVAGKVKAEKLDYVLRHELGHSLNVHLMHKWGGTAKVRAWHAKLYRVSEGEGFVSKYARTHPIENAAELTRLYLYDRKLLVMQFPKAFAMLDAAYRDIWRPRERTPDRPGEAAKREREEHAAKLRGHAKL
jgi:hypothetical protein